MLSRLEPNQVTVYWEEIKSGIIASLPPTGLPSNEGMAIILNRILKGDVQVWVVADDRSEAVRAAAVTTILEDGATETRNLLIYSLYGYSLVPQELWVEGLEGLKKFAKAKGCYKIVAYTKVPRVVEIARSLGALADTIFLEWRL